MAKQVLFASLLLLPLAACVTTGDFNRLRSDVDQLRRESFESKKDVATLREKTSGVVREDTFSALRESQADSFTRITDLSSGLQELRGRFEENRYFTEKTLKDNATDRDVLRAQISSLEGQVKTLKDKAALLESQIRGASIVPPPVAPGSGAQEPAGAESSVPSGEERRPEVDDRTKAYEAAYQAFKDKKYKEARESFNGFIKTYPKNELTDNAQFWIAETYYAERDYEGAILAYETLLKKYPESEKTNGGLLKQGFSFVEIGDNRTGKIILERLIEKAPESREAELAKKKIEEMEKKPPKKK